MKKVFSVLCSIVLIPLFYAQFVMINDKDGFTNLRSAADINSEVIFRLNNEQVFQFDREVYEYGSEWIPVSAFKNNFAIACDYDIYFSGYIHRSRILILDDLPEYQGKDFQFKYNLVPFSKEGKFFDYYQGKWITKINGRPYFGRDGDFPKTEIKNIEVSYLNQPIDVPEVLIQDLFEIDDFRLKIYPIKDLFIVRHWNSDGAGGYALCWVFNHKKLLGRYIFIP